MPIDFRNVNISLTEFQRLSKGKFNAGEVKLTSETTIDKVNNHVEKRGKNGVELSHDEVLAIKNAFIRALAEGGVDRDEINNIRRELGLAPMKEADTGLRERSLKPLSRQQIREILDRNAETINEHLGPGTIRTSEQLYARVRPETQEQRRLKRELANTELPTRRSISENKFVAVFQSVVAGDVDFYSSAERKEMLKMAKRCLDAVLMRCHGQPRQGVPADISRSTPSGKTVTMNTGLDEVGFVRKLEKIIVRLSMDASPRNRELAARREFKALATPEAREEWCQRMMANMNNSQNAVKARAVAVMIMHERGIADAETLSIVNQLKNGDAVAFAVNLVRHGMGLEGDALRHSDILQGARATIDPEFRLHMDNKVYIPAITNQEFNRFIASHLSFAREELPQTFMHLVDTASFTVRARYGAIGYPDNAHSRVLLEGVSEYGLTGVNDPDAPCITPETLRDGLVNAALKAAALRVMEAGVSKRIAAAGLNVEDHSLNVLNALRAREPAILEGMLAAESAEAADAVLNEYAEQIQEASRRSVAYERCYAAVDSLARERMAAKLGVPVESLPVDIFTTQYLRVKGNDLKSEIGNGKNPANSDAEIEAAFSDLVERYVNERVEVLAKIGEANIPADAKDAFKMAILRMDKVNYLDIDAIVNSAKAIHPDNLIALLDSNADKQQVYEEMHRISDSVTTAMNQMFAQYRAQGKEIGPDENTNVIQSMLDIIVLSAPGLEAKLSKFLTSDAVRQDNFNDRTKNSFFARNFIAFVHEPDENTALAAQIGTAELPPLHALALVSAVREEGLGNLSVAEAAALFKAGEPAGEMLRMFVETSSGRVRASALGMFARSALRKCKAGILAARQANVNAETEAQAFLAGEGATRALAAGFARVELPRIAKIFAFYKIAANATDEAALAAALDPNSKASRLLSYGGRFTTSVENFAAGLKLLDDYANWYATVVADFEGGKSDTPTLLNGDSTRMRDADKRSHEKFIFEEIAINNSLSLRPQNAEDAFGMAKNPATRFVGRSYMDAMTNTLAQIPPEKRSLLYAVFDAMHPLSRTVAEKSTNTKFSMSVVLASRVLKNYDAVAALRAEGNLDRAHIIELLLSDFGIPTTATNTQIYSLQANAMFALANNEFRANPNLMGVAQLALERTGATKDEVVAALLADETLPNAPYVASMASSYDSLFTSKGGRSALFIDLHRPAAPSFSRTETPLLSDANAVFKFRFPDGTTLAAKTGAANNPEVVASTTAIADKVEQLCGKVHQPQLSAVYYALSQSGLGPLNRGLDAYGITTTEHSPVIFTFEKNTENGDIKIRYSEPEGFPLHFSWETTIHLDGTSESTPMVVDVPPDFAAKRQASGYNKLAGVPGGVSLTSATIAPGQGPASTAMRNLVDTRCGAPANASPTEKANTFVNTVNTFAAKNMSYTLSTTVSKNLVSEKGGKHMDFENVHSQFNRDLKGGYKFRFPGGAAPSNDYNTNRDRLVQFVTGNRHATFADASAAVMKRVGILMSLATQYPTSMAGDAVSSSMALPGNALSFFAVGQGGTNPDVSFSKDANGDIKVSLTASVNMQALIIFGENEQQEMIPVNEGSHYSYLMEIHLPKANLDELAEADWTQFNREAVQQFEGDMDGRIALIPEQYRFKGTIDLAYHMHLEEPAQA